MGAEGLPASYVQRCTARSGWCSPAVALKGTRAAAQRAMKRARCGADGNASRRQPAGADLGAPATAGERRGIRVMGNLVVRDHSPGAAGTSRAFATLISHASTARDGMPIALHGHAGSTS